MVKVERQAKILQHVRESGFVNNGELAEMFDVSLVTIRRDLRTLGRQKLIKLEHGGAAAVDYLTNAVEPLYETKAYLNADRKVAIGAAAAALIEDGDTIVFDAGTTVLRVAQKVKEIGFSHLTAITNDTMIANELCAVAHFDVIVLGGRIRTSYYNTFGPFNEMMLKTLKADKAFLGVDAASLRRGISNLQLEEIAVKQRMIAISDEAIAVTDSSKFGLDYPYQVCTWDQVHAVVTDADINKEFLDLFESLGIRTHIVSLGKERK